MSTQTIGRRNEADWASIVVGLGLGLTVAMFVETTTRDDWNSVFHRNCQIQLIKIFRQTDDIYSGILNQIREGKIKRKSNDLLLQYVGREYAANLVAEPTKLFPTRNKVEQINNNKMFALQTEEREYSIKYLKDLEVTKSERVVRLQFSCTR